MEKQLKKILIGMLVEFTRKEILEKEIISEFCANPEIIING